MVDGTPLGIPTAHTMGDLRAVASIPAPQRATYYVRAVNDVFGWDPTSSDPDNDATVIRPTDRASLGGRWVRVDAP